MGRYLPEGGINTHFISQPLSMSGQWSLRLFNQERRKVSLSWYPGQGGRSGLIISWDPLPGRYTTWLLSKHISGSSGGRATSCTLETARLDGQEFGGLNVTDASRAGFVVFRVRRILTFLSDKHSCSVVIRLLVFLSLAPTTHKRVYSMHDFTTLGPLSTYLHRA